MPRTATVPTNSYVMTVPGYGQYRVAASITATTDANNVFDGGCQVTITYARRFNAKTGKYVSRNLRLKERTALEREVAINHFYRTRGANLTGLAYTPRTTTTPTTTETTGPNTPNSSLTFVGTVETTGPDFSASV
jgi:hypothetical protein